MFTTFKIVTVAVVIVILGLFAVGAYKAERIIDSKAQEMQQTRAALNKNKSKK
ncbi:MAG TPA: hypothetical protein PLC07_03320 [Bacillota bacterium]|nr:hypothetical protein [Bacillota bacterium]